MITKVANVSLFVNDQDAAKDFYTNVLGFELRGDSMFSDTGRWLAVAPKGAETEVILYKPDENWSHYAGVIGKSQAMTFNVTDLRGYLDTLKGRGVQVVMEPDVQPWGTFAMILDHEGNALLLVEQPENSRSFG